MQQLVSFLFGIWQFGWGCSCLIYYVISGEVLWEVISEGFDMAAVCQFVIEKGVFVFCVMIFIECAVMFKAVVKYLLSEKECFYVFFV